VIAGEPGSDAKATPPAADPAVSQTDFKAFASSVLDTLQSMQGGFNALASARHAGQDTPPAEPAIEDVTDDEVAKAVEDGDARRVAQLIRKAATAASERSTRALKKSAVEPLQTYGVSAIASLATRAAKADMPHYDRFKKEIDDAIAKLPLEARLNPDSIAYCHHVIVGLHAKELVTEAEEGAVRKLRESGQLAQTPTGTTGRTQDAATKVPTVAELLGDEVAASFTALGKDPDHVARKLGYPGGWAEYAKKFQEGGAQ